MPLPKKVENYLKKANKKFDVIAHKTVFTAYDLAQTLRSDLKKIAKALLVKADNEHKIVIVPASLRLNMEKLKKFLKAKKVSIADEKTMTKLFKVKPGALSAFGKLHKVETVIDKSLLKVKDVIVQAGSFTDSVRMKVKDFIAIEHARLGNFTEKAKYAVSKNPIVKKAKSVAGRKRK